MNIIVLLKMVPDLVEELEIDSSGKSLDTEFLRMNLSESDDHALEQALLLKEKYGGKVIVITFDWPEVDDVLFAALAKGADRAVKIPGNWTNLGTPFLAHIIAQALKSDEGLKSFWQQSLILTGSQAIDDIEGELAPYLSEILQLP